MTKSIARVLLVFAALFFLVSCFGYVCYRQFEANPTEAQNIALALALGSEFGFSPRASSSGFFHFRVHCANNYNAYFTISIVFLVLSALCRIWGILQTRFLRKEHVDPTTWRCPKCGTLNKRGIHICSECGSDAPSRSIFRN